MWAPNDKRWLFLFVPFLLLVVGLLLWLHLFGVPTMENGDSNDLQYDKVILTSSAPAWVEEKGIPSARKKLPKKYAIPDVVEHREAENNCTGTLDGEKYEYPCEPGAITYVIWDQKLAWCNDESCEAGVAFWHTDGPKPSCTIMVPPDLQMAIPLDQMFGENGELGAELPPDAEGLLVGHEHIHCKRGKPGHIFTPIFGPLYSVPTGHIMHPNFLKSGWGMEGL